MICWLWNDLSNINLDMLESSSSQREKTYSSDRVCSKGLLPNKFALAGRKMETLLGAEFKTLDWILYLNVDLQIFFPLIDSIYHYFNYGFNYFFFLLLTNEARWVLSLHLFAKSRSDI